jgi:hypothetical protein
MDKKELNESHFRATEDLIILELGRFSERKKIVNARWILRFLINKK